MILNLFSFAYTINSSPFSILMSISFIFRLSIPLPLPNPLEFSFNLFSIHFFKNGIVLSPSLEKGFDAKDDLSRFQILAKVPYGFLGDEYIKYNAESNKDWYARNAILRLVQASGRSIRGVTDYADTYILDSNFKRLYDNNKQVFPVWYKDSLEI